MIPIYEEFDDDFEISTQKVSSADTSINSELLPAVFNKFVFEPNTLNLDYGGGKFDNATEELAKRDVLNCIYDPYNRSDSFNQNTIRTVRDNGGADSVTCANVLNVIAEPEERLKVLRNIKRLAKPGADIYIQIYEGNKSGEGKETSKGWQCNLPTNAYIDEVQTVFPNAKKKKTNFIVATA